MMSFAFRCGVVCFVAGFFWVLLFPLINISSGELKPRSFFVDENAILVSSIRQGFEDNKYIVRSSQRFLQLALNESSRLNQDLIACSSLVAAMTRFDVTCDEQSFHSTAGVSMVEFSISSGRLLHSSYVAETSEILVLYSDCSKHGALLVALGVIRSVYAAPWNSKRVTLVMFKVDYDPSGSLVRSMLSKHLSVTSKGRKSSSYGLVRDALVLDITGCANIDDSETWSTLNLRFSGSGSTLPNMDSLTALLSIHDDIGIEDRQKVWLNLLNICRSSWCSSYVVRLGSLWNSFLSIGSNLPIDGHAVFLANNIDALTIVASKESGQAIKRYSPSDIVDVTVTWLRIHSNLHEELHHSMFFYYPMGNRHFVGISEFGSVILLLLLPFLFFQIYLFPRCCNFRAAGEHLAWDFMLLLVYFFITPGVIDHYHNLPFEYFRIFGMIAVVLRYFASSMLLNRPAAVIEYCYLIAIVQLAIFSELMLRNFGLGIVAISMTAPLSTCLCLLSFRSANSNGFFETSILIIIQLLVTLFWCTLPLFEHLGVSSEVMIRTGEDNSCYIVLYLVSIWSTYIFLNRVFPPADARPCLQ